MLLQKLPQHCDPQWLCWQHDVGLELAEPEAANNSMTPMLGVVGMSRSEDCSQRGEHPCLQSALDWPLPSKVY